MVHNMVNRRGRGLRLRGPLDDLTNNELTECNEVTGLNGVTGLNELTEPGKLAARNGLAEPSAITRLRGMLEGHQRRYALRAGWIRRFVPTGLDPLDAALPHGGLPAGTVTEILCDQAGTGATTLAVRIARSCLTHEGALLDACNQSPAPAGSPSEDIAGAGSAIFIDTRGDFYPPALLSPAMRSPAPRSPVVHSHWPKPRGLKLQTCNRVPPARNTETGNALTPRRLIVLRPRSLQDAYWAMDQSLRCPAVAVVIAPFAKLDQRRSRRFQLAAQSSGCLGLILRSARSREKSFAAVRLLLEGVGSGESTGLVNGKFERVENGESARAEVTDTQSRARGSLMDDVRPCRITFLSVREGMPVEPIWVDLHHETGTGIIPAAATDRSAVRAG